VKAAFAATPTLRRAHRLRRDSAARGTAGSLTGVWDPNGDFELWIAIFCKFLTMPICRLAAAFKKTQS
jgi:hypothetical protein